MERISLKKLAVLAIVVIAVFIAVMRLSSSRNAHSQHGNYPVVEELNGSRVR